MSRRLLSLRRRDLLLGGSALGAWKLWGCGPQAGVSGLLGEVAPAHFPLGAGAGDVGAREAVLWTKYLGDARLELQVALESGGAVEQILARELDPSDGGFVHAPLDRLLPGAEYRYAFVARGAQEQRVEGRFRAAPPAGALERMTFSASACTKNGRTFGTLEHLAQGPPVDLHLLLGDTVYADGSRDLEEYRARWTQNLSTSAYRSLRQSRSVLATWDDHEISNDWSGEEMDATKRALGTAAFFEHTPLRRDPQHPDRIWRSFRWGHTAEFFLLDGRSERRPETRKGPEAEYLSSAQLQWLKDALARSPARFKVLVSSVPIGAFPGPFAAWTKDQWVGYAAQREALLSFIEDEGIEGAFFISGDFHMASLNAVSAAGPGASLVEVLTGAAATSSPNPFVGLCTGPQFSFTSTTQNVATFFLDPERREVGVQWTGESGQLLAERTFRPR